MKKRPLVAVLNTLEATAAQVITDSTAGYWFIAKTSAGKENLLGPFPIGKIKRADSYAAQAEVRQAVLIGCDKAEVIAASTRYRIEIGTAQDKYESEKSGHAIHAYTTASSLSGDADTDRKTVYSALVDKINNYAGNNVTAYLAHEFDFTAGTDTADGTPTIGATYTQATSSVTGLLGKVSLSSGTWAGDNAAGTVWVYACSADPTDAAYDWTGETSITLTQTNATLKLGQGIVIVDDAGYFTSNLGRSGANYVGTTQGFATAVPEIIINPVYPMGVGSVMKSLMPVFDHTNLEVIRGDLAYDFQDGMEPDAAKTYTKHVIVLEDGDEDAIGATKESAEKVVVVYAYDSNGTYDTAFTNAIAALT